MITTPITYDVYWGYGSLTLKSWADNPSTPQDAIDGLLAKLQEDRAEFFVKTMLTGPAVKAAGRRRAKFKAGASVIAALTDVGPEYEECGIYVFDTRFAASEEPEVLLNFHTSRNGAIAGRKLLLPDGGHAGTFFLCGVSTALSHTFDFLAAARTACSLLGLEFAYLFRGVGYEYDGKTPLEWAYKNHSARLRSGMLKDIESVKDGLSLNEQS